MIQDFLVKHLQFPNTWNESYDLSGAKLVALGVGVLLALGLIIWKRIIVSGQSAKQRNPSRAQNSKRFHWLDAAILVALAAPMFFIMKLGVSSDFSSLYHVSVTHPLIACAALFLVCLCAVKFDSTLACILLGAATIMGALGLPSGGTSGSGSMPVVVWDFQRFETGDATHYSPRKYKYLHLGSGTKFGQLIRRLKLAGYQPNLEWLEAFSTLGKQGFDDLKELARDDSELPAVVDAVVRHKFGISENLSSRDAWSVLDRIEQQATLAGKYDHTMVEYAATKILAPYLDTQQVVDKVMASIDSMPSPQRLHYLASRAERKKKEKERVKSDDLPLKILWHVARVIDEGLNEKSPDEYSVFEQQFGDAWFARNPPRPSRRPSIHEFRLSRSGFGSPMADAFVKRQTFPCGATMISKALGNDHWISGLASNLGLTLPAGEMELLGGAQVDLWQQELMFLDTPTGREYRQDNQKELLDIAIRSIGPSEKKVDSKDRDRMLWAGALRSQVNQSGNNGTMVVPHLEFLFLDLEARKRSNTPLDPDSPSLAMKFWPHYDAKLEAERQLGEDAKLKNRWAYLARLWPESTSEMFADAYFRAESKVRQFVISDYHHERLPETLPVDFRLSVYQLMLECAKAFPAEERSIPIFSFGHKEGARPKNEVESIKRAIATLDCPEGASAYAEVWAPNCFEFLDGEKDLADLEVRAKSELQLQFCHVRGANLDFGDRQYRDGLDVFLGNPDANVSFLPRDDRIESFAKHENSWYRQVAIALIRERPTPRLVGLLDALVSDEDAAVKSFALTVRAELDSLLSAPMPRKENF